MNVRFQSRLVEGSSEWWQFLGHNHGNIWLKSSGNNGHWNGQVKILVKIWCWVDCPYVPWSHLGWWLTSQKNHETGNNCSVFEGELIRRIVKYGGTYCRDTDSIRMWDKDVVEWKTKKQGFIIKHKERCSRGSFRESILHLLTLKYIRGISIRRPSWRKLQKETWELWVKFYLFYFILFSAYSSFYFSLS